jgi:hypothetical protein
MLHHLRGALESADLGDASNVASVPFDAEFEILVGIESLGIDAE